MIPTRPQASWHHRPLFVILLLLALGPFAFPWLWKTPFFSPRAKIVLTLLTMAATVWLLWITYGSFKDLWERLHSLGLL